MSERIGNVFCIEEELPDECEACGELAELRPYGKDGANVCYPCAMKDPGEAKRQIAKRFEGVELVANILPGIPKGRAN